MATPIIELTQSSTSWFSQYSLDSPPCFIHLLIQSNEPVLKTTHAIGDIVQSETYPAPCIFLGMKQTALVDNEAYYEAEYGMSGIPSSFAHHPHDFHLQLQDQIQRDHNCLPPSVLSWEWFQDKLWT